MKEYDIEELIKIFADQAIELEKKGFDFNLALALLSMCNTIKSTVDRMDQEDL